MNTLIGIIVGLVIACIVFYFLFWKKTGKTEVLHTSSVTILEKIEKVFKIVLAEGYFSDIYDYKHDKNLFFDLLQSRKKALLIANARVLIGYDFAKMHYQLENENKKIIISTFPAPEILAIDPDYKFYDTEEGILNKFGDDDYTLMINDAKKRICEKALQSELPKIAAKQMKTLLSNIDDNTAWQLFYQANEQKKIPLEQAKFPYNIDLQ